jgi:hypothetical protein
LERRPMDVPSNEVRAGAVAPDNVAGLWANLRRVLEKEVTAPLEPDRPVGVVDPTEPRPHVRDREMWVRAPH